MRPEARGILRTATNAAVTAAMLLQWTLGPAMAASEEERATTFAAQVQASMTALEDGARDAPRDRWDPQYVVDTVGIDPDALTGWVRENVRWMPYRGALRGPEGVLMDRVGNSLDQALLLARMLTLAGYDARLAHAALPPATVRTLWDGLGAGRDAAPPAPADTSGDALAAADLYGIDPTIVAAELSGAEADAAALAATESAAVTAQSDALAGLIGAVDDAAIARTAVADAAAALADHWWVQSSLGDGWTDHDPAAAPGGTLAPAAETYAPDALPADMEQTVTIRVVTEQFSDGALSEQVILEQPVRPRDVVGTTIGFRHFPMAWPGDWPQVTPDDVQIKLRSALYAQTEWLPVLVLGDAVVGTVGVKDSGEIDPDPRPANPFMQMSVSMIGAISKAADILATGADPDAVVPDAGDLDTPRPPRPEGELTAERLEFVFSTPGRAPWTVTRDLFDLVGPAARATGAADFQMTGRKALERSMAMLQETEIAASAARMPPEFLAHLGAENALGNRPVLDELSRDPFGRLPANYMELFSKLNGLPAALLAFAAQRFALNPTGPWVFPDRPNVTLQHIRLSRAGGGDFVAGVGLDIVENGVGVDPLAALSTARLRLAQGVADTRAEVAALAAAGAPGGNPAAAFADGAGWRTLSPESADQVPALGYPPDAAERIATDLASGRVVVAAPTPDGGWWRFDPATGDTLGLGPLGHGQAMVEYALIIIIEAMMAGAQCALEASLTRALDKTLAEKAKGMDSGKSTAAGLKAGYEQASADWTKNRNRCIAAGMFAGFRSLLIASALNAARTAGNKGLDDLRAKPSPPGVPPPTTPRTPSRTPTKPGLGDTPPGQPPRTSTKPGLGEPGPKPGTPPGTPTRPGVGPEGGRTPTKPGLGPQEGNPAAPRPAPPPAPLSPRDRFMDAQSRAAEAEQKLTQHKRVDTPEGSAAEKKLWSDLDQANRDRIKAWDSMPSNQRPINIPPVPGGGPDVPAPPRPASPDIGTVPTQPGVNPTGPTQPGIDPMARTEPGANPAGPADVGGAAPAGVPPSQRGTADQPPPSSEIPVISPRQPPPTPSVDDLLDGLGKQPPAAPKGGVPAGEPTPDSLLDGLGGPPPGGGRSSWSGWNEGDLPPPPPQPAPPPPDPGQSANASGLAGLTGALDGISVP